MNDADLKQSAGGDGPLEVVLDRTLRGGRDFVIRTATEVIVGGNATARLGDAVFRHDGPGDWTRYPLVKPPEAPRRPLPQNVGVAAPTPPDRIQRLGPLPVEVVGLRCQRDHLVHPGARLCPLCGDNMQNRSMVQHADGSFGDRGPRPPLGVITLQDGRSFQLSRTTILGRQPEGHESVRDGTWDHLVVPGERVSRAHARIVLDQWDVSVEDLGSANGTWTGIGVSAQRIRSGEQRPLIVGTDILLGNELVRFDPTSAAGPGLS